MITDLQGRHNMLLIYVSAAAVLGCRSLAFMVTYQPGDRVRVSHVILTDALFYTIYTIVGGVIIAWNS